MDVPPSLQQHPPLTFTVAAGGVTNTSIHATVTDAGKLFVANMGTAAVALEVTSETSTILFPVVGCTGFHCMLLYVSCVFWRARVCACSSVCSCA